MRKFVLVLACACALGWLGAGALQSAVGALHAAQAQRAALAGS